MTTLHSDSQLLLADPDMSGYLGAALNRLDDGGDRVMFEEPDSLADCEWPPVELVLDHYEACLGGGPQDDVRAVGAWIGRDNPRDTPPRSDKERRKNSTRGTP